MSPLLRPRFYLPPWVWAKVIAASLSAWAALVWLVYAFVLG